MQFFVGLDVSLEKKWLHNFGRCDRWNLLSHAFLEAMAGRLHGRTLNDYCEGLFDAGHGWSAFPLERS